jgi:error-prone DNA polymerase
LNVSTAYCELHTHSQYSLLDGMPKPEALVDRAAELGISAVALTDHDALYGIVPFVERAAVAGVQPIIGSEMTLEDGSHLTLLAETQVGYSNLTQLITAGRANAPKGQSSLPWATLEAHTEGLICLTGCRQGQVATRLMERNPHGAKATVERLTSWFGREQVYIEIQRHLRRHDRHLSEQLVALAQRCHLPTVATGNVHYLTKEDAANQRLLVSLHHRKPLPDAARLMRPNYNYYMRSPSSMARLYTDLPEALASTVEIAGRCTAMVPRGLQVLPQFPIPPGLTTDRYLRSLCRQPLLDTYGFGNLSIATALLEKELAIISQLGLSNYFLIVHDIIAFCQRNHILIHGRGSAANSIVAYLLGITAVDPLRFGLVVERFLSVEKGGTPDIDLDIEHAKREQVIQYVYERWGRENAAMACTYSTYRTKSSIRDAAWALGIPADEVSAVQDTIERYPQVAELAHALKGRPRHVGLHNGGMIVAGEPIARVLPTEAARMPGRTVVQADKDQIETLGIVKIDLLGLRMLSAISDTLMFLRQRGVAVDLHRLDMMDQRVYDRICSARTIGIFQVESGAQVSLIPHLQPRCFDDLVVEVSLIRPGPLQGNMVKPYIRRRQGREPVTYPHALLEPALSDTLGVIVFQEQVIKIARDAAGFSAGRGELLRKALGSKHAEAALAEYHEAFIRGTAAKGIATDKAEAIWNMIRGFAGYSFSKAHAAAFAVIVYWSAWLRVTYPVEYFCGLLRSAPLGTYPARVLESEARRNGIKFLPFDINLSQDKPVVEGKAIRHGLGYIRRIGEKRAAALLKARGNQPFTSLADVIRRTSFDRRSIEALILAGALDTFGERRQLLWDLVAAFEQVERPGRLGLQSHDERVAMRPMSAEERTAAAFAETGVTVDRHLADIYWQAFARANCLRLNEVQRRPLGVRVRIGGVVADGLRTPPTAKGTGFIRVENADGMADVIIPAKLLEDSAVRKALRHAYVIVDGRLQAKGATVSVVAETIRSL